MSTPETAEDLSAAGEGGVKGKRKGPSAYGGWPFPFAYKAQAPAQEEADVYQAVVTALLESPNIQGFVYTQLCDVEQEINGLMTCDRELKIDPAIIRHINRPSEK